MNECKWFDDGRKIIMANREKKKHFFFFHKNISPTPSACNTRIAVAKSDS